MITVSLLKFFYTKTGSMYIKTKSCLHKVTILQEYQ